MAVKSKRKLTVVAPPRLRVIKHVVNNNDGSRKAADFILTVSGNSPSPASFPGADEPGTLV